jgi:hypothetical protein
MEMEVENDLGTVFQVNDEKPAIFQCDYANYRSAEFLTIYRRKERRKDTFKSCITH